MSHAPLTGIRIVEWADFAPGPFSGMMLADHGADGLLEGFRPGVLERLGLGPDVPLAENPKLVFGPVMRAPVPRFSKSDLVAPSIMTAPANPPKQSTRQDI